MRAQSAALLMDHPRVSGEHLNSPLRMSRPLGSPPRERGALPAMARLLRGVGITPA